MTANGAFSMRAFRSRFRSLEDLGLNPDAYLLKAANAAIEKPDTLSLPDHAASAPRSTPPSLARGARGRATTAREVKAHFARCSSTLRKM